MLIFAKTNGAPLCNINIYFCTNYMMTEQLRIYYHDYKILFEENFQIVLDNFDVQAIHKMRTSTKRLRALFLFLEFVNRKKFKAKKQLNKIRVLFKYSGRIREIQIEQMLVATYQDSQNQNYSEYLEYLKRRELKEISRFLKHLPNQGKKESILNDKKVMAAFDRLDKNNAPELAQKFVRSKEDRIRKIISAPHSNSRIHTIRTHLKQLYYLFEILTGLTGSDTIIGMTHLRIREIEQFFGDWHDLVNSPVYMNAFFKTKKFSGEKKYYSLKKEIANKRKEMRQEIIYSIYPEIIS